MEKTIKRLRNLLLASSFFFFRAADGQIANYVTNGGFEKHTTCDITKTLTAFVVNAIGWDEIKDYATKWNHYCYGAVPFNGFFYNNPRSDSAYASADFFCLPCAPYLKRTNFRNKLKANLKPGKTYCLKFYINISENSAYGIDGFGAYFGGSELDTITQAHIALTYLTPQISNPVNYMITDTVGWTIVSGTFTANGNEKYMVIGNLKSDASTNTVISNPSFTAQQQSGCTIGLDDVSCIPIDLPAYAGHDTTCIPGTSVYLGRQRDVGIDEDCMWYKLPIIFTPTTPAIDTAAGIWVSPTQTSTYIVRQEICGMVKWDTVVVYKDGVGLNELRIKNEELKIYPVPANNYLKLKIEASTSSGAEGRYKLNIINGLGQTIKEEEINFKDRTAIIKTDDLSDGVYSLLLKSDHSETISKRFVISKS